MNRAHESVAVNMQCRKIQTAAVNRAYQAAVRATGGSLADLVEIGQVAYQSFVRIPTAHARDYHVRQAVQSDSLRSVGSATLGGVVGGGRGLSGVDVVSAATQVKNNTMEALRVTGQGSRDLQLWSDDMARMHSIAQEYPGLGEKVQAAFVDAAGQQLRLLHAQAAKADAWREHVEQTLGSVGAPSLLRISEA